MMIVNIIRKLKNLMHHDMEGLHLLVIAHYFPFHQVSCRLTNYCKHWTNYKLQLSDSSGEQPETERNLRYVCIWKKGMTLDEFLISLMAFCLRADPISTQLDDHGMNTAAWKWVGNPRKETDAEEEPNLCPCTVEYLQLLNNMRIGQVPSG